MCSVRFMYGNCDEIYIKIDIVLNVLSVTCRSLPHICGRFILVEGNEGNKQVVDGEGVFLTDAVCFTA